MSDEKSKDAGSKKPKPRIGARTMQLDAVSDKLEFLEGVDLQGGGAQVIDEEEAAASVSAVPPPLPPKSAAAEAGSRRPGSIRPGAIEAPPAKDPKFLIGAVAAVALAIGAAVFIVNSVLGEDEPAPAAEMEIGPIEVE